MNQVKTRKTGIFSGSFNPIHIGHLALANYLCEYEGLDEIWFMVSPQNPLKTKAELWSDELRLQLVELSISDYPRFRASDFEFHLPRPSYSVYTLEKLREAYPDREFYFIIGSDNWERFGRWYQSKAKKVSSITFGNCSKLSSKYWTYSNKHKRLILKNNKEA
jgi:nicotinate-nucleotide adenylyltransferase